MRECIFLITVIFVISCARREEVSDSRFITVSIAPFKYFVEEIAEDDFTVNIMVPAGADPHIYEPYPEQIRKLKKSIGYISNGYLGFETIWLKRFYDMNKTMKRLSVGEEIIPLVSDHNHDGDHAEGKDPHYWMSPKCGLIMAESVKEFLCELNPAHRQLYEANFQDLLSKIHELDDKAEELFSGLRHRTFMIYHPNLGYLARDYNLEEISLESDGKEPSPSKMKELIDQSREDSLKTIFVQREYDLKNANVIAEEIGAKLEVIDPLSEDWLKTTSDIITALHRSFIESSQ